MAPVVHAMLGILIWGGVATLSLNAIMFASQQLGWSRMNWSLLVGTLFTGDRHVATILGFVLNFFGGYVFAFLYFLAFALAGTANAWLGLAAGLLHGTILMTVALPLLVFGHPRIASEYDGARASKRLEPPGFLALNYGYRTPLVSLIAHAAYGAVLGSGFERIFAGGL